MGRIGKRTRRGLINDAMMRIFMYSYYGRCMEQPPQVLTARTATNDYLVLASFVWTTPKQPEFCLAMYTSAVWELSVPMFVATRRSMTRRSKGRRCGDTGRLIVGVLLKRR